MQSLVLQRGEFGGIYGKLCREDGDEDDGELKETKEKGLSCMRYIK